MSSSSSRVMVRMRKNQSQLASACTQVATTGRRSSFANTW